MKGGGDGSGSRKEERREVNKSKLVESRENKAKRNIRREEGQWRFHRRRRRSKCERRKEKRRHNKRGIGRGRKERKGSESGRESSRQNAAGKGQGATKQWRISPSGIYTFFTIHFSEDKKRTVC